MVCQEEYICIFVSLSLYFLRTSKRGINWVSSSFNILDDDRKEVQPLEYAL
uniref:Uncharacterized protein n=1 Tax=Lepeophtheirus salmonis TaxID=72036 RepID=A0A0K2U9N9_LEPSM